MSECPTCEAVLTTKRGMRQHHTKVHGESLPNRTCQGCETEFYDPKADLSFCEECNPYAGEHNGNWKDATETAVCRLCGAEFEFYPSNKEGVYCPECVSESSMFLGERFEREAIRLDRRCRQCEKKISVLLTEWKHGRGRFCGFDCLCAWMAKDDRTEPSDYGEGWKPIKTKALERDNHSCQNCGITASELGQEPDVHHIIPIRKFEDSARAHTLNNVVCLCRGCHRRVEVGSIPTPKPSRDTTESNTQLSDRRS